MRTKLRGDILDKGDAYRFFRGRRVELARPVWPCSAAERRSGGAEEVRTTASTGPVGWVAAPAPSVPSESASSADACHALREFTAHVFFMPALLA